jgi:SAM-dependent methyltransferase
VSGDLRDVWNARYRQGDVWGSEPNRLLAALVSELPVGTALDLGCGQGRNALWLAGRGHTVTGLDLSPVAVEQARSAAAERGLDVRFEDVDLAGWDAGGEVWDLVVLSYLQLDESIRPIVHAKAAQAVAPGGRLILIAHHRDNLEHGVGGPPTPRVLYTEAMLAGDFADLEIQRNERVLRPTDEGDAIDVLLIATRPHTSAARAAGQ